jgi:hypothetical protein
MEEKSVDHSARVDYERISTRMAWHCGAVESRFLFKRDASTVASTECLPDEATFPFCILMENGNGE